MPWSDPRPLHHDRPFRSSRETDTLIDHAESLNVSLVVEHRGCGEEEHSEDSDSEVPFAYFPGRASCCVPSTGGFHPAAEAYACPRAADR
jgi:hypothetical protein